MKEEEGRLGLSGHVFHYLGSRSTADCEAKNGILAKSNCSSSQILEGVPGTDAGHSMQNPPLGKAESSTDKSPLIADVSSEDPGSSSATGRNYSCL